jgi:hypothetical protein
MKVSDPCDPRLSVARNFLLSANEEADLVRRSAQQGTYTNEDEITYRHDNGHFDHHHRKLE